MRFKKYAHRRAIVASLASVAMLATAQAASAQGHQVTRYSANNKGVTINEWATPEGANGAATTMATLGPLAAQFKKQTGITVKITVVPWSDLLTKLLAAVASGNGPDLSETGDTWSGQLAATGGFVPITNAVYNAVGGKGQFIPRLLAATGIPGKAPMSFMEFAESWGFYYNKAMFKSAGIASPPATWAQFVTDAKKLNDPSKGVWGLSMDLSNIGAMETWEWVMASQYGGQMFSGSGKHLAVVNTPGNVAAMTAFLDWLGPDKIIAPDNAEYNNNQAEIQFAHGKAAMTFTQTPSTFAANGMPASAWGTAKIPLLSLHLPASRAVMSHLDGVNIAMFKSTKHLSADEEWLKFLFTAAPQTRIAKAYGVVPVTKSGAAQPYFVNDPNDKVWLEIQSHYAQPMPWEPDEATLQAAYCRAIGQLADAVATSGSVKQSAVKGALDNVESAALAREQS